MAAFVYAGPDSASSTAAEKEDISFRINQALKGLGNGWMVHIDAVRHPSHEYPTADRNFFPSKIAAAIALKNDANTLRLKAHCMKVNLLLSSPTSHLY